VAWQRTGQLRRDNEDLRQRLIALADRLAALEATEAKRRLTPMPAATADAPPAAATPPVFATPVEAPPVAVPAPAAPSLPEPPPVLVTPIAPAPAAEAAARPAAEAAEEPSSPIVAWLVQGNPIAKLGVILLFFGLAYLLRFASERGWLPIEVRLAGAAAIAMALLAVGWRLRERRPVYALTLQGGSIGALYLTSFAAFRVYSLLPSGLVFALLIVICAASVALAVLQRAQSLALLASLGGYLAPILLSTGGGNHVALFSYYTVLSAGILAVSFWRAWRPLNLIGFVFTFGMGILWGVNRYEPSMYGPTQILLGLNVLIYGILAAFAALRRTERGADALVDGTLVFGTPVIGFGLQAGLTRHWKYGPAFSALAFGAVYLPLAWLTLRRWPERARRLTIAFLALGGGFATLAIPLALAAKWTSMAWALEGLAILWVGRAQASRRTIWSGTGLLALAGASGFRAWADGLDTPTLFMVLPTLSLAWLAAAWMWSRDEQDRRFPVSGLLLAGGVLVWVVLLVNGSDRLMSAPGDAVMLSLAAMSATAVAWSAVAGRAAWIPLGECGFVLWPFASLVLAVRVMTDGHPIGRGAWDAGWLLACLAGWHLLRWGRSRANGLRPAEHASFAWFLFALVLTEAMWRLDRLGWGADEWRAGGLLAIAAAFLLVVWQLDSRGHWAPAAHPRAYWVWAVLPPLAVGTIQLGLANLLDGRSPGWPYVPLINPIELAAAFMLLMGVVWRRAIGRLVGPDASVLNILLVAGLVWWINGLLLRTLASVGRVPWAPQALWDSAFLQTSMALAWTVAALVCMALAHRRSHRQAWFVGAGALAVVVVKLFLVDSARGGGLARAVAFIGVAVLILVIGYLAPLPPRSGPREGSHP
jgi:uncharacterized membrane protein